MKNFQINTDNMGNFIYSRVSIEPEGAMNKIYQMIENMPPSEYGKETKTVVETFYTEEEIKKPYNNGETEYPITENGVNYGWLYDNVGTKWITVGIEDDIRVESPSYIPDGFLIKLYSLCIDDFENVSLICKWYNENEIECGTVLIKKGIYTEDQKLLSYEQISDPSYGVTGEEPIDELRGWLISQVDDESYTKPSEIKEMTEKDLREMFEDWKNQEKWDNIVDEQENMFYSCEEAIDTEDFNFPVSVIKKIAYVKYVMITDCYPFK
jgi:hypothetical protein